MLAALRRAIVLTIGLAALSSVAFAQGHVTGIVRDTDGKPLKGATVTLENPDVAPSSFTSTSDAKGRFNVLGLHGGTWKVTVRAPGFAPETTTITTRSLGQNPTLDVALQPKREPVSAGPLQGIQAPALQQQLDAAAALAASGKDTEAIAAYRQIASRTPALTSIHLAVGALLERQHDYDGARAEYKALLAADPENVEAKAALERISR